MGEERKRMAPDDRRSSILAEALDQARRHGYNQISRAGVAAGAGVSEGLVSQYFQSMEGLRRAIMQAAIHQRVHEIVAQGLVAGDRTAEGAPEDLKREAMNRYI